jgi:hypothetical protein
VRLQLGEEDRKRLDCPEWLDVDLSKQMIDDAIALESEAGIGPDEYDNLRRGKPVFEAGQPVLSDDGRQVFHHSATFYKIVVWFALRGAGLKVPWSELTFDRRALEIRSDVEPTDDQEDKTPQPD